MLGLVTALTKTQMRINIGGEGKLFFDVESAKLMRRDEHSPR
jgi:hypothetical protein